VLDCISKKIFSFDLPVRSNFYGFARNISGLRGSLYIDLPFIDHKMVLGSGQKMKLLGIISVGFDVTNQLLITFSAFVRYWRKNGSTMRQYISYS
jgi:hypothetical protein